MGDDEGDVDGRGRDEGISEGGLESVGTEEGADEGAELYLSHTSSNG